MSTGADKRGRWRRSLAAGLVALGLLAAAPGTAGATTTCAYDAPSETLEVAMSAPNDGALLKVGPAQEIVVSSPNQGLLACGGGTLANTEAVNVFDKSGGATKLSILEAADFVGTAIDLVLLGGPDEVFVTGSPVGDAFVIGTTGINTDAAGGQDVNFISALSQLQVDGGEGNDTISGQGGSSTGSAFSGTLHLVGSLGDDTLQGGEGGDLLEGGDGNDVLQGGGGNDALVGDALANGDDTIEGGAGSDTYLLPFNVSNPLTVDLARTGPQDTGYGTDAIAEVENVYGSSAADTLLGDAGSNTLNGQGGDDTIDGRGGADALTGSSGSDTVTYEDAPGGVTVSLESGSAGGDGADSLSEIEDVIGSPFDDSLTGSDGENLIRGLGGSDTVAALGGRDLVEIRDGAADQASCGAGIDRAVTDRLSLDAVQPDCETLEASPEPPGAGPAPQPAGPRALGFELGAAARQRVLKQKGVVVTVRCPQQACTATARLSGKLKTKPRSVHLQAGTSARLKLRPAPKQLRAIRRGLRAGRKPKLKVLGEATAPGLNPVRRTLTVIAKR